MTLINTIIAILAIIPIIGVVSDIKKGKIKNIFIFPFLVCLIILWIFIDWFYISKDNMIQISIILCLWYIFYINNKWWAWDGKYILVLWFALTIIGFLKWIDTIILPFISLTFLCISIFIIAEIVLTKKDKKIIAKKENSFDLKNSFFNYLFVFILSHSISYWYTWIYIYLVIFLIIFISIDLYKKIAKYFWIHIITWIIAITIIIYWWLYIWFCIWLAVFFTFIYIWNIITNILEDIDIQETTIWELKKGDILYEKSISKINADTQIWIVLSPLQWEEVFKIIEYYKPLKQLNEKINIYKDIRVWIYIYIAYVITIFISLVNL